MKIARLILVLSFLTNGVAAQPVHACSVAQYAALDAVIQPFFWTSKPALRAITVLVCQQAFLLMLATSSGWSQATPPAPQDKPGVRIETQGDVSVSNLGYTPAIDLEEAISNRQRMDLRNAEMLSIALTGNAIGKTAYLRLTPAGGQTKVIPLGPVKSERPFNKRIRDLGIPASELGAVMIAITDTNGRPLNIDRANALLPRVGDPDNSPDLTNVSETPITSVKGVNTRNVLSIPGPFKNVPNMVAIRIHFSNITKREGIQIRLLSPIGEQVGTFNTQLYSDGTVDYDMNAANLKRVARIEVRFDERPTPLPLISLNALVPIVQKVILQLNFLPGPHHQPSDFLAIHNLHIAA